MKGEVEKIIELHRAGIEGDGGSIELIGIEDDGTIKLKQEEDCACCLSTMWTHRLRVERAIRDKYPDAHVDVDLQV